MAVSKNSGGNPPKMDGENNGKPYFLMNDLGGFTPMFGSTPILEIDDWNLPILCFLLGSLTVKLQP